MRGKGHPLLGRAEAEADGVEEDADMAKAEGNLCWVGGGHCRHGRQGERFATACVPLLTNIPSPQDLFPALYEADVSSFNSGPFLLDLGEHTGTHNILGPILPDLGKHDSGHPTGSGSA